MIRRHLASLFAAALTIAAAGGAAADSKLINPCRFSSNDSPCRVRDGVYRALVPQTPGPHPAVVYLYGSLGLSTQVTSSRLFQDEIVRQGYALIVPAALDVDYATGERGTGWGRRVRPEHPRDDLDFIRRVLKDAEVRFNVDRDRLIFAGQSDGGYLIYEIACHTPDLGAAFAVHGASYGWELPDRCASPVRFLHAHGMRDRVVPFEGEEKSGPWTISSDVGETLEMMARSNRCRRTPRDEGRFHGFERQSWTGCAEGGALDLLVHEGGHGWPGSWMKAVLAWFDETSFKPAVSVTRKVGEPSRFRKASTGGGRFLSAPSD